MNYSSALLDFVYNWHSNVLFWTNGWEQAHSKQNWEKIWGSFLKTLSLNIFSLLRPNMYFLNLTIYLIFLFKDKNKMKTMYYFIETYGFKECQNGIDTIRYRNQLCSRCLSKRKVKIFLWFLTLNFRLNQRNKRL